MVDNLDLVSIVKQINVQSTNLLEGVNKNVKKDN